MLKKHFDRPIIMGAIGGVAWDGWRNVSRELSKYPKRITLLRLSIDPRSLKNIALCMKLVDVQGLIVADEYQGSITRYLKKLDVIAKASGRVDTITMRRSAVTGFDTKGLALRSWLRQFKITDRDRLALIIGDHPFMKSFRAALLLDGWRLTKSTANLGDTSLIITGKIPKRTHDRLRRILQKTPSTPLHISLDKGARPLWKKNEILKLDDFMRLFYRTSATLLTSRLKSPSH